MEIVDGHQVEVAAMWERHQIAVEQHDRQARLLESFHDAPVDRLLPPGQFERGKEHPRNARATVGPDT